MYIYPTETNNQPRDLTMTSSTQETIYIHLTLKDDLAYNWSVEHNDARNMQMVLRAYKESFSIEAAELQIETAKELA